MLDDLLKTHKVIICCGCGGVGKTTISATLGLRAAQLGKKVIVLTIDPAKRLADSLGIGELTNEPKQVQLTDATNGGEMWAMMLDVKDTLDDIITEFSKSPQQSKDILENPIYQQFSQNFGGGQEYGGMSRLYQINQANEYDIIILDTPPSQHAIDFINAPAQLKDFFSQSVLKFFLPEENDRSAAAQIISKGSGFALKVLQKLTGSNFIEDLSSFLSNFQGMYEAFRKQSDHVSALLEDSLTGFLIISGAEKPQLLDSSILYQKLSQMNLPFRGLIVNKSTPPREIEVASTSLPLNIQKRVNELFEQYKQQINYEDQIINELVQQFKKPAFVQKVSSLSHDVYNVETLLQFSHYLTNPISYKTI